MVKIKHKNYLLFVIVVAVFIASGILLYPLIGKIKENKEKIQAEKIVLDNNIQTDKKINKFQEDQKYYANLKSDLSQALISQENTLELIIPLENIARDVNIKQNLEILEKEQKNTDEKDSKNVLDNLAGINVRLQLEGEYQGIVKYLFKLKELGLMYDINSMTVKQKGYIEEFNKKSSSEEGVVTEASIELKFFTQ